MNELSRKILAGKLHWLWLVLFVLGASPAAGTESRWAQKHPRKLLSKAQGPIRLELEAVDLAAGKATVLITGIAREPEARLFVLHDDRERHFIAVGASCQPAKTLKTVDNSPGEAIRCQLDLPRFYLGKGRILGLTVHLRGREIEANAKDVQEKFAAVRAAPPAFSPDGGMPKSRDGAARD